MKKLLALFALLGLALAEVYWPTPTGVLIGENQGDVARFMGLSYARAERFARPRLLGLPTGTFDARKPGPACPQVGSFEIRLGGFLPPQSEDCLNLNVWVPLKARPEGGWPVMVFLHGGSFTGGSGAEPVYDGAKLARAGVIVVTLNYRLGPFGYLALPAAAAADPDKSTGNWGLLDQIAALRWVKQHIRVFGGNPARVTLFGESAGAMSACDLMTSPLSKGLFSRVILESGGCDQVHDLKTGYAYARKLGKELGCDADDLACWRALPVEKLLKPLQGFDPRFDFKKAPFKPHIDGYALTGDPEALLEEGAGAETPMLAGANRDEYRLNLLLPLIGPRDWRAFADWAKARGADPERALALYRARFADPVEAAYAFETERLLLCPTYRALRKHQGPGRGYYLTYHPRALDFAGAFHSLDVPLVFGTLDTWPAWLAFMTAEGMENGERLGRLMRAYWTRFAKGEPLIHARMPWPELESGYLLRLDVPWGWAKDPYPERCALFR